ncbi:hypothetical protein Tco_1189390, partial [Tanacetum coccineum]
MSFINPFNIDNFLGLRLCLPFVRTLPSKKSQPQRRSRKKDTKRGRFEMKRKPGGFHGPLKKKWHCAKARAVSGAGDGDYTQKVLLEYAVYLSLDWSTPRTDDRDEAGYQGE